MLANEWGDDPQANLGITVPGYPNLFCIYGPATNLAHAGSLVFNSECQVRYILGCIGAILENDCQLMECTEEANTDYNERLQDWVKQLVWASDSTNNWYKNSKGKVTANLPWRLVDYWKWTREPDLSNTTLLAEPYQSSVLSRAQACQSAEESRIADTHAAGIALCASR